MACPEDLLLQRLSQVRRRRRANPHRAHACDAQERLLVTLLTHYRHRWQEGLRTQLAHLFIRTPLGREKLREYVAREGDSWDKAPSEQRLLRLARHLDGEGGLCQLVDRALSGQETPNGGPEIRSEYVWAQIRAQGQLLLDLTRQIDPG